MDFSKQNEKEIYSTNSDLNTVFVEVFNRTIIDLLKEPMYIESKSNWLNHLELALKLYNNRKHSTMKWTPIQKSKEQIALLKCHTQVKRNPRSHVEDDVRVPDKRNIHSKNYTRNGNKKLSRNNQIKIN